MWNFQFTLSLPLSMLLLACGEQTAMQFDIESAGRLNPFEAAAGSEPGSSLNAETDANGFESADLSAVDVASVFDGISTSDDCGIECAGESNLAETEHGGLEGVASGGSTDDPGIETEFVEILSNLADYAEPTDSEINACATLNGVSAESIKLAGNQTQISVSSASVVAVKLTGNESRLSLEIKGSAKSRIGAICIFLAGNQTDALIQNHIQIGRLVYVGRGNQSHTEFLTVEGASLQDVIGDLAGNQAGLSISGEGEFSCGHVRLKGRSSSYECR
jgi:hypothetical protein